MDLTEICPKHMCKRLMREMGAEHNLGGKPEEIAERELPPIPPKKKKTVSFILEPTVVT